MVVTSPFVSKVFERLNRGNWNDIASIISSWKRTITTVRFHTGLDDLVVETLL
jgi:hypothetical protein